MSERAADDAHAHEENHLDDEPVERISTQDLRKVGEFLFPFIKIRLWILVLLSGVMLAETVANVSFSLAQRYLIDHGLVLRNLNVIFVATALLGASAILASLLGLCIDYIHSGLSVEIIGDIREVIFARCQKISLSYYDKASHGETISRFSGDTAAIETALLEAATWLVLPLLQVFYSMALMFYFNVWLGCAAALIFPVTLILPRYFAHKTLDVSFEKRVREARLLANIHENISLQSVIRAFSYAGKSGATFKRINAGWRRTSFKAAFWGALVERSAFAGLYLLHVGVFALGVWIVYLGRISLGTLIVFEALFLAMGESLAYAMAYVPKFAAAAGGIRHINELLSASLEMPDLPDARPIPRLGKDIVFSNVGFSYGDGSFRIRSIDVTIEKGMKVAIVGPSGCGKSTLLGLLMRFRAPTEGSILIDGQDIRSAALTSLRDKIGFVAQQPMLFGSTIFDNIAVGNPTASVVQIERAAAAAEISQYIGSLELGYQTSVGEGGAVLSVGQRQRICIARALVRDPDILLLDEPTGALDAVTEASITQTLWRAGNNRTLICATHRLAGITDQVDQIVVLDNGTVKEAGTHETLLARNDLYSDLWHSQNAR